MRKTSNDLHIIVFCGKRFSREPFAHQVDKVVGQIGQIAKGQVLHLPVLSVRVSEKMRNIGLAFVFALDSGDVDGSFSVVVAHAACFSRNARDAQYPFWGI